jgi:hypothetical protein
MTQEVWHLRVLIWLVVVSGSNGVQESLIEVAVNNLIAEVVVTLLPIIFGEVRRVEVNCCHI